MAKQKKIREGSRLATAIMYALAALVVVITLYPMYYVLILSLSAPQYALTMQVYTVPKGFDLSAYKLMIGNPEVWRTFGNTVLYAAATTVLMLATSFLGAFPLTFKSLMGRKYINMYLLITMFFSGGLIPSFLLIMKLGMYDSPLALIIPACFSVWNIILTKAYLSTIPETLREAARIDGASVFQIFARIYLPLSTPILAVIAVYTVVGVWNSWFSAMVYLPSLNWQPLQIYLRRMLIDSTPPNTIMSADAVREMIERKLAYSQLKYAMIIFSSLPVLFTYPFFQRYFMKGIMLGSLKE
ncbi:MAG: carbohydrate ABC transporter permease [Treponema sp.]|jgi:putative aldouronate transport system permease protein|nr:carbohydrate ABC transporter permease [Treponema sp.]